MENYSNAEPYFLESINNRQKLINHYFPTLSEKEKQDFYFQSQIHFSSFLMFCVKRYASNPSILGHLYNFRLATKGLLFNTSNKMRQRIMSSKDEVLINQFKQWQSKRDYLAKVYQMPLIERKKNNIDEKQIEEEVNSLEKQISLKSELFGTVADRKQYHWEDVRHALKPEEAAVEMMTTYKIVEGKHKLIYLALIVTPQTQLYPDVVILENGEELEGKFIKYFRNAVKQNVNDEISYNQYWKPIADNLKGVSKVYFSADGVYNQLNLNAMYNPASGNYIIDEVEVQLVTSTKDILTNMKSSKPTIKEVTFFGYPDYNNSKNEEGANRNDLQGIHNSKSDEIKADSLQRFFNGETVTELPGTKVEVEAIEALLKKSNITTSHYMFDKASEGEVKKINNPQILHIATHGFFLSDLSDSGISERGFGGIETQKIIENPLLRSGLLFAGVKDSFSKAGASIGENKEDGILTAYEVMSLNIDQTDLVVMSACETGLGVTSNGEGVYGLQRAFQVAGAKSVLMSLWTVSDDATQQLMTLFYQNWLYGKAPREAFRMAQLSLREKYPEPYFWGAFVLVGN